MDTSTQRTRPSSNRRGYDHSWRKIRARFLTSHPNCVVCGSQAQHVDHRVPLSRGGTHDESNLQPLCHRCHSRKTASRDGGFGNRRRSSLPTIQHVTPVSETISTSRTRVTDNGSRFFSEADTRNRAWKADIHSGKFTAEFSEGVSG